MPEGRRYYPFVAPALISSILTKMPRRRHFDIEKIQRFPDDDLSPIVLLASHRDQKRVDGERFGMAEMREALHSTMLEKKAYPNLLLSCCLTDPPWAVL